MHAPGRPASEPETHPAPRLALSTVWLLYLGGLGVFFPYWSLYLERALGYSATEVGLVLAAVPAAGLVAQPLWGRLADRTGARRGLLALLAAGAAAIALWLGRLTAFPAVLAATALFSIFHAPVLPLANTLSLGTVGRHRFGTVRVWGTVGFLIAVLAFPPLSARLGARFGAPGAPPELALFFVALATLSLAAALAALACPRAPGLAERSRPGDGRRLLRHAPVVRLLVLVFFAHLFIQGPIHLFPLYVSSRGGDASTVSRMWLWMLLLEIPLIAFSGSTLRRFGARGLILAGLLAESLRWSVCALTDDLRLVAAVQLLHGVGVAGILIGAPLYLESAAPARLRATAQALVSMAGFGAGSILSNALGGWGIDRLGIEAPYAAAGGGALLLALALGRWLPPPSLIAGDTGREQLLEC